MSVITYGQPGRTYGSGFTYGQDAAPVAPPLRKRMTQAALKLDEKNLDQAMDLGVEMEEGLKNKPAFATVAPTPAAMATRRGAIATQRGKLALATGKLAEEQSALDALELDYRNSLTAQAGSAILAVSGDAAQLEGANIPLRKAGTPASDAPPPLENVSGTYGDLSGEVDWQWNAKPGRVYIAETGTTAAGPFAFAYSGTRSRFTSKNHPPGSEVFLRVKCTCNGFESNWSQLASHRAR